MLHKQRLTFEILIVNDHHYTQCSSFSPKCSWLCCLVLLMLMCSVFKSCIAIFLHGIRTRDWIFFFSFLQAQDKLETETKSYISSVNRNKELSKCFITLQNKSFETISIQSYLNFFFLKKHIWIFNVGFKDFL